MIDWNGSDLKHIECMNSPASRYLAVGLQIARQAPLTCRTSLRTDAGRKPLLSGESYSDRNPLPFLRTITVLDGFEHRDLSFSKE
jgi:hypothetical protein